MEDKKMEVRQKGLFGRVVLAVIAVVVPLVLAIALVLMYFELDFVGYHLNLMYYQN